MNKPKIAFIGLGNMGSGMANRLIEAGYPVTVFNRTKNKTEKLIDAGAIVSASPKEAAANADILITMVSDDHALESVLLSSETGALQSLKAGSIHISMSTVSEHLVEKLTTEHTKRNVQLVGAPVFGRPAAAALGKLFILFGGPSAAMEICGPVFSILGQKVIQVGESAKAAHLTKILGNFMLFSAIESMAESIAHAKASGLSERLFLEAMTSTIFTAPIYTNYGTMMVEKNFPTEQAVSFQLALKDVSLALKSAEQQKTSLPMADLIASRLQNGISNGYEKLDVSALVNFAAEKR